MFGAMCLSIPLANVLAAFWVVEVDVVLGFADITTGERLTY